MNYFGHGVAVLCGTTESDATEDGGGQQLSRDSRKTSSTRLTASGKFGDYVMLTTPTSAVVVDGKQLTTHCHWHNVTHAGPAVWVEPLRL